MQQYFTAKMLPILCPYYYYYLILVFIFLKGSDGDDVEIFTLHNGHSLWFLLCSLIGEVLLESSV